MVYLDQRLFRAAGWRLLCIGCGSAGFVAGVACIRGRGALGAPDLPKIAVIRPKTVVIKPKMEENVHM